MLVLKNARVLPELTVGCQGDRADIVIEGERIVEVLPAGEGAGKDVVDVEGRLLLPGLIDAHVHLDLCGMSTWEENEQPDTLRVLRGVSLAKASLKKGFTTLRDCGDRNNIIIDLARAIKEGYIEGPDILAAGMIITPTESGNEYFKGMYAESDGRDEIAKNVRKQIQRGADWIKYMGTGAVMNPGGEPGSPVYTEEEVNALCIAASLRGIPVVCHAHGTDGMIYAINNGVRTIEHASMVTDEVVELLLKKEHTYIVPTLTPSARWFEAEEDYPQHYIEKARKIFDMEVESVKKAYEAGIKIGLGSDAGVYANSHGDNSFELKARVKYTGLKPIDVLIQATKTNAEMLMIEDQVGTIQTGKKANLVIIDGNPVENIMDIDNVVMVIKDGKIV